LQQIALKLQPLANIFRADAFLNNSWLMDISRLFSGLEDVGGILRFGLSPAIKSRRCSVQSLDLKIWTRLFRALFQEFRFNSEEAHLL
jgi:hypothetical protein